MTDFYYKKPQYILGAKNKTSALLRNVNLKLYPDGGFEFGSFASDQEGWFMDPGWPVPEKIDVSFSDENNKSYSLSLVTGLPKDYSGKVLVVIIENEKVWTLKLETSPLDK